jgi:hypothetical protein
VPVSVDWTRRLAQLDKDWEVVLVVPVAEQTVAFLVVFLRESWA